MEPTAPEMVQFLRRVTLEMRRIADGAPGDVAHTLHRMASDLDVDADELCRESIDPADFGRTKRVLRFTPR